ncbi:glutamyl-tRNA synthetase [Aspergillus ellipticus CBS 707.79]|uniref:Glutamate--tRNA ligase, mitochondrial n=1 Tax=Aspergillus ellipticus CBS 707.79 TaxID=1448320 RepID=A0A319DGR4_9EURO|nr:glutamyl-tRNA synthetase [Aspergillus ellipticus CBS 707.79]
MRRPTASLLTRRLWTCNQCRARFSSGPLHPPSVYSTITKLPESPARTRFAPSPTGYLHLGSLRTALFNYLLAKRTGGQFLLRIEDTDKKRSIPGAEQRLYDDLQWAGLYWDEGPVVGGPYGPYRQSERTEIYRKYAQELIDNGHAYRCFCSSQRLHALAQHRSDAGLRPGYDRECAGISAEESEELAAVDQPHIIRLKVDKYPIFKDIVYGKTGQSLPNRRDMIEPVFDDPVLIKTDGQPTYHMANVVDDHLMEITHVIRGSEWMNSTPLHVALYNAFNWTPPAFAHVPLLTNKSGQKLSKRNADIDITFFKEIQGIFPSTLVNFAALLGWSHTGKSDVFDLRELENLFNLKFTKGNTVVAFEKLWFLQKEHASRFAKTPGPAYHEMLTKVIQAVKDTYPEQVSRIHSLVPRPSRCSTEYVGAILRADAKSYTNAPDFVARNATFFADDVTRPEYEPTTDVPIQDLHTSVAAITFIPEDQWTLENLRANIEACAPPPPRIPDDLTPDQALKLQERTTKTFKKALYHYLRWALSGGNHGPGMPDTLHILGYHESVRRLNEARKLTKPQHRSFIRRVLTDGSQPLDSKQ